MNYFSKIIFSTLISILIFIFLILFRKNIWLFLNINVRINVLKLIISFAWWNAFTEAQRENGNLLM